ncbi:MAG: NapC/NirT family cytochrome c, partial [Actinobacteria bacterium]|nr:NapC/NirT family cytochrome c [Actinomycetota bacterium]
MIRDKLRKISLAGFKDPKRRPRYIIWTATAAFFLAGFILFALMVTSTNWFCADICHAVQVDSVMAWERSTHANVSCVSCHMSVNM